MNKNSKIYLAGHTGLVGSAIYRKLKKGSYNNIIVRDHPGLDLINQDETRDFFMETRPEYVILAAAKVGGIMANNTYRADFIYDNIQIQNNVIRACYENKVKKLLFLGSSCIYPKNASQPIREDALLTSELEYTNEPYAIAKIAGLKMCEAFNIQYDTDFLSVMPTNLYGPNDNFDLETSHALPALIRKFRLAKALEDNQQQTVIQDIRKRPPETLEENPSFEEIEKELKKLGIYRDKLVLWGSGKPLREFLYSEDLAEALIFLLNDISFKDLVRGNPKEIKNTHINIGTGKDLPIRELAQKIKSISGFTGKIEWDISKPDGTYRKSLNVDKINRLGWTARTSLDDGLKKVYKHYCSH